MSILAQIGSRLGLRRHRNLHWEAVRNQRAQIRDARRAARQAIVDLASQADPMPPGTLVKVKHHRDGFVWIVAEPVPSVGDVQDLRIVRQDFPNPVSYVASILSLDVVGHAEFTVGQKVRIGIDEGELRRVTDTDALVCFDLITSPLRGGGSISYVDRQRWHPIWHLALENDDRLRGDGTTMETSNG